MEETPMTGSELKRRFNNLNAHRTLADKEPLKQKELADTLGVSPTAITQAFSGIVPGYDKLRGRIAEYLDSLEQGKKPLPNRSYPKEKMVTR